MQFVVLVVFVGLLIEWNVTGRKIRKLAIERFGTADGGNMTIGFYAGSRAYLPRRWRLPSPRSSAATRSSPKSGTLPRQWSVTQGSAGQLRKSKRATHPPSTFPRKCPVTRGSAGQLR